MTGSREKSCGKCRFFEDGGVSNDTCHRRSPQVVIVNSNYERTRFPTVSLYDWCGEFVPKIEEQVGKNPFRREYDRLICDKE